MQGLVQLWRGLARGTKVVIGAAVGLTLVLILFPPSCSDSQKTAPAPTASLSPPAPPAPPSPATSPAQQGVIMPSIPLDKFAMTGGGAGSGDFGTVKDQGGAAAPSTEAPPAATPAGPVYEPGALVVARPSPEKPGVVPVDSVGSFVYGGGDLHADAVAQQGVIYKEMASLELQGWMPVKEAGRYQFQFEGAADASLGAWAGTCALVPTIEGKGFPAVAASIATNAGQKAFTLLTGVDLQPGVYKVSFWVGCVDNPYAKGKTLTISPYIKGPSDANFRQLQAADIAHKKS